MAVSARKQELLNALPEEVRFIYGPLVDNIVMLEKRMRQVRTMPFLRVSKKDPSKQRPTEASRLFKNLQIEYATALKYYNLARGGEVIEETSPLREYLKTKCGSKNIETR